MPLVFIPNAGQSPEPTRFSASSGNFALSLEKNGLTLTARTPERESASNGSDQRPIGDSTAAASLNPQRRGNLAGPAHWRETGAHLDFIGANPQAKIEGLDAIAAKFNYFLGKDSTKWRSNVPAYSRVRYRNLYAGVDMLFYGKPDGSLEYDLVVAANADPGQIHFRVTSREKAHLDSNGNLQLDGDLALARPMLYQDIDHGKKVIAGAFVEVAEKEFAFKVKGYDRARPLIIDPAITLLYATYIGGLHNDIVNAITVDSAGNSYIVGASASQDFPVSGNAYQTARTNIGTYVYNGTVTKFSPSGVLLYSTFLGNRDTFLQAVAVDGAGNAYVAGYNADIYDGYPTTPNSYSSTGNGIHPISVLSVLSPDGSQLNYSSYLASNVFEDTSVNTIALDGSGAVYVAGWQCCADGAFIAKFDLTQQGSSQLLHKFDLAGSNPYHLTQSPANSTGILAMAVDGSGNVYAAGQTRSSDFPVTSNALPSGVAWCPPASVLIEFNQPSCNGNGFVAAGFISILSADFSGLKYSSFWGGGTALGGYASSGLNGLRLDSQGNIWVYGQTLDVINFPTSGNAVQGNCGRCLLFPNAFLSKFSPDGTRLLYSTYLTGGGESIGNGAYDYSEDYLVNPAASSSSLAIDSKDNVYVIASAGLGSSYPVTPDAYQSSPPSLGSNAVVSEVGSNGSLIYSTFFGGVSQVPEVSGVGIGTDAQGNIYIAGEIQGNNLLVTSNAFQSQFANGDANPDGNDIYFAILSRGGVIGSVSPAVGGNTGDVTVTIGGAGFEAGAVCWLVQGGITIQAASSVPSTDGSSITCTFALDGAAAGGYNIVVSNPGGTTVTREGGFTVQSGGQPQVWTNIVGRPAIRTGVSSVFDLVIGNSGLVDAYLTPLYVQTPGTFGVAVPGGIQDLLSPGTQYDPANLYYQDSGDGTKWIPLITPHLAPGSSISVPLGLTDSLNGDQWSLGLFTAGAYFSSLSEVRQQLALAPTGGLNSASCTVSKAGLQNCLGADALSFAQRVDATLALLASEYGFTYDDAQAILTFEAYYAQVLGTAVSLTKGSAATLSSTTKSGAIAFTTEDKVPFTLIIIYDGKGVGIQIDPSFIPTIPPELTPEEVLKKIADEVIEQVKDKLTSKDPNDLCMKAGYGMYTGPSSTKCVCDPTIFGTGVLHCKTIYQCQSGTVTATSVQWVQKCPAKCKAKGKHSTKASLANQSVSSLDTDTGADSSCFDGTTGSSIDPNDKSGPSGSDSPQYYIPGDTAIPYHVAFENQPTAALPAAQVVVTDQLDPTRVDVSTLALGGIVFGANIINPPPNSTDYVTTFPVNSRVSVRIQGALNPATGLLKWTFTTIDPTTGLPPSDPTVGFLPPDADGIKGQGSVLFTVMPKAGLATGTQITNQATVVFDANKPINTQSWLNTIDATPPVSKVAALPAQETKSTFTVSWSGSDVGSGIASYTIYVSDNGGAYTVWQSAVTTTSASYTGQAGHTYAFYSISTDGAGNVEGAKNSPDASTTVVGGCGVSDVTAQMTTSLSGFRYDSQTQTYVQGLTVTNNGAALTGPFHVVLGSLSAGATVSGAAGETTCAAPVGAPYVEVSNGMAAGQTVTIRLQFTTTVGPPITYVPSYVNGTGTL